MIYPNNLSLPEDVRKTMDEGAQTMFRLALNGLSEEGHSEILTFCKAYRILEEGGFVRKDGIWTEKGLTVGDVHVNRPLGSEEKDDPGADLPDLEEVVEDERVGEDQAQVDAEEEKKDPPSDASSTEKMYAPPLAVHEAAVLAKSAGLLVPDITEALACSQPLSVSAVRKIADHFEDPVSDTEPENFRNAWGGPTAERWALRVLRKLDKPAPEVVEKAGNGVMLAFWPPIEVARKLAAVGGEKPEELHVTLGYFGKLSEFPTDAIAPMEKMVESFAASHAPITVQLGGFGRFPATPNSDGKDVMYLGVHSSEIRPFRQELIALVESVGAVPKKDFEYTPHMTLMTLAPHAPHFMKTPSPVDVTFDRIVLSIGTATKEYVLSGEGAQKDFRISGNIEKVDQAQHLVFGWASIVKVGDRVLTDTQNDMIMPGQIEETAYDFVLSARKGGEMHQYHEEGEVKIVSRLVESAVFTKEKQTWIVNSLKAQGILEAEMDLGCEGWWVGFHVDDPAVWAKVVSGELKAFSIGGTGKREKVAA